MSHRLIFRIHFRLRILYFLKKIKITALYIFHMLLDKLIMSVYLPDDWLEAAQYPRADPAPRPPSLYSGPGIFGLTLFLALLHFTLVQVYLG
jgi:hypothetical protein